MNKPVIATNSGLYKGFIHYENNFKLVKTNDSEGFRLMGYLII